MDEDLRLIKAIPSQRQMRYMENAFYCFIHYSMNTYTDSEWGDGTEKPEQFCPEIVDTDEWAQAAKSAGMQGIILTCKHHDGFCLWPSKYTKHSVQYCPYLDGKGDIVKSVSDSCRKYGLKFGVYLSPWDRNSEFYGNGKEYDDYYVGQLTELLTGYGEIFAVWLDGACGENVNGKKQDYDWDRYYSTIRNLQPDAVISICGPDIRWCGNEAGQSRKNEWSVVPARLSDPKVTGDLSQKEDDPEFRERPISPTMEDLGSREFVSQEKELMFYPSEVDVSIRPGWFYHSDEDDQVKSAQDLFDIYCRSVGHNCSLLLNIPIMPNGHMHSTDINNLRELGDMISTSFSNNLLLDAHRIISGGKVLSNGSIAGLASNMFIDFIWKEKVNIHFFVIQEDIQYSQRIERYRIVSVDADGHEEEVYNGSTVGNKEIVRIQGLEVCQLRVYIEDSRANPVIKRISAF